MTTEHLRGWLGHDAAATALVAIAVGTILLAYYIWRGETRLSSFPGPRLAAWSRLYSVAVVLTGKEHEVLLDAHDKYGTIESRLKLPFPCSFFFSFPSYCIFLFQITRLNLFQGPSCDGNPTCCSSTTLLCYPRSTTSARTKHRITTIPQAT
jgi:hypothetical protein